MKRSNLYNCLLFALLLLARPAASQSNDDHNLFISGGVHAGFINLVGMQEVPYNIHADKLLDGSRLAIGAGYSCDFFNYNPFLPYRDNRAIRQNFRLRLIKFSSDTDKRFAMYQGFAFGASFWKHLRRPEDDRRMFDGRGYVPTVQFFAGMRYMINESLFWQGELAIGAPYSLETGIGVKF